MLVVISIIGILTTLALASFTKSQKQARDTQRKSDLRQYQTSLEIFSNENDGLYTSRISANGVTISLLCSDIGLASCFEDPKNTDPYIYKYVSNGTGSGQINATEYSIWSGLEATGATTTYWVVCSNGNNGESTTAPSATNVCPL